MPTSSNVSIHIDPADAVRVVDHPARVVVMPSGYELPVTASVWFYWSSGPSLSVDGSPADVAAWFRRVAEQIEATIPPEDLPIPFTVTDAGREALGVVA